ncbi:hypothetical protein L6164_028065 [Bauhinia variegata]|uniref:Uncharacterized protein n=1 Tax=Bauhinia variegata TaxID=167791 RepID=A0ACB9LVB2_BAUVA|nr:hypothetical protein L6164_028065 [Bauhinia variegata]
MDGESPLGLCYLPPTVVYCVIRLFFELSLNQSVTHKLRFWRGEPKDYDENINVCVGAACTSVFTIQIIPMLFRRLIEWYSEFHGSWARSDVI